jgi:hypothetical protein
MNASTKPTPPAPSQPKNPSIDAINSRVKGGAAAGPSDTFAFDFTQDKDGKVSRDKAPIVE